MPRPLLPGGQDPQPKWPVPLWPSAVIPADPETDQTPRRPANYTSSGDAYAFVSALEYPDIVLLAEGKRPEKWHQSGYPTGAYVRAAREFMSTRGNPVEINARMDGPIKQVVEKQGTDAETRAILAVLSSLPPMPAQRRTGQDDE